jgi:hypothetical protein
LKRDERFQALFEPDVARTRFVYRNAKAACTFPDDDRFTD